MHKKFEVDRTKIKGGCQSYTKAGPQQSWSDLALDRAAAASSFPLYQASLVGPRGKSLLELWVTTFLPD